jgi:hypothetical protein
MIPTKDGQYYYAPHRRQWGIWQYHEEKVSDQVSVGSGTFIKDCPTKAEARAEVYRLNGWASPKTKPTEKYTQ